MTLVTCQCGEVGTPTIVGGVSLDLPDGWHTVQMSSTPVRTMTLCVDCAAAIAVALAERRALVRWVQALRDEEGH